MTFVVALMAAPAQEQHQQADDSDGNEDAEKHDEKRRRRRRSTDVCARVASRRTCEGEQARVTCKYTGFNHTCQLRLEVVVRCVHKSHPPRRN